MIRPADQTESHPATLPETQACANCIFADTYFALHSTCCSNRPAIPVSNSGSLHSSVSAAAPPADTSARDADLKRIEDRVRHRQSVLMEQTNELQQLEKRLQAAEARKRELESRGGFI